jgi:hypothetical protein
VVGLVGTGCADTWDAAHVMESASGVTEQGATNVHTVILVEGMSDKLAVEALAARSGRLLDAEGISVISMGGAMNIGRFLDRFGPCGRGLALAGLYDVAEEPDIRRGLERAGLGSGLSRADMERLGFHACVEDLEDELIRALGPDAVMSVVEARGELGPLRTLRKQPEWRSRPIEQQLRRFLGNASRKIDYAPVLVDELDPADVPRPLEELLARL